MSGSRQSLGGQAFDLALEARGMADLIGHHDDAPAWSILVTGLLHRLADGLESMEPVLLSSSLEGQQ